MHADLAVQGGIDEGVVAGRAHGHHMTADLYNINIALPYDVKLWVQIQQQVQHLIETWGSLHLVALDLQFAYNT